MQRHLVIFDGQCPFCCRTVRWLQRLDWLRCLHCVPAHEAETEARRREVTMPQLMAAMHCFSAQGRIYRGAHALRFVGLRLPLLCLPALLLYLPGVLRVAEHIYRAVAARRYRLARCPQSHCPAAPQPREKIP
jgi:predicted DCC family thiol-disulfide oxidoreductase YuxK